MTEFSVFPINIPSDITDLICGFMYNRTMKQIDERIKLARESWFLPVPSMWLRFYDYGNCKLDWNTVYDFEYNHTLDMHAVADTASFLHYSCMKHSAQISSQIVHRYCKGEVVRALRGWKRGLVCPDFLREIVNLVWFALCGKYTLIKSVYNNHSIDTIQKYTFIDPMKFSVYLRHKKEIAKLDMIPGQVEKRSVVDWMLTN